MISKPFYTTPPPLVLRVVGSMEPGSVQRNILETLIDLDTRRFRAQVLCVRRRAEWGHALAGHGIPTWSYRRRVAYSRLFRGAVWRMIARLTVAVRKRRPAVMHIHQARLSFPMVMVAKLARVPCIVLHHHADYRAGYWGTLTGFQQKADRWAVRHADVVVASSHSVAEATSQHYGLPRERIEVVPNGARAPVRHPGARVRPDSVLPVVPEGAAVVGIVGRMRPERGWEEALNAAAELVRRHDHLRFWLVGETRLEEDYPRCLKEQIDRLGLTAFCEVMTNRHDLDVIYGRLTAALFCSRVEGCPVALLDLLASGVPIVAADTPHIRELVGHQRQALLTAPENFHEQARALDHLLRDEALRSRLIREGREVAARYSWEQAERAYERIYQRVLEQKRRWVEPVRPRPPDHPVLPALEGPRPLAPVLYLIKTGLDEARAHIGQSLHTITALARAGQPVTILAPMATSRLEKIVQDAGVTDYDRLCANLTLIRLKEEPRHHVSSTRELERTLRRQFKRGHRILYFRQPRIASLVLPLAHRIGYRVIMENHCPHALWSIHERREFWHAAPTSLHWFRRAVRNDLTYEQDLYQLLDGVINTTRAIDRRVRRLAPQTPTLLLPNGAPNIPDELPPYGPDYRDIDILYVGKTAIEKGTDQIIRAMEHLPGFLLQIVGGPTEEDLAPFRALAQALGVEERIVFRSWMPQRDVLTLMRQARVAVHPLAGHGSREWRLFTCPLKILEYMAAGTPVVSTRLPAILELLTDGQDALLAPPADARALAECLRRVLESPQLAESLRLRAFDRVRQFSTEARAAAIVRFLNEISTGPAPVRTPEAAPADAESLSA